MQQGSNRITTVGEATGDSSGVTLTANATQNVKGSYAEIVASTPFDSCALYVILARPSANLDYLIDIAIGAGGSEKIIVENLLISGKIDDTTMDLLIPFNLPAGTRLSARCQCGPSAGSGTIDIAVSLFGRAILQSHGLSCCTTYGAATGSSGATGIDPGGTANTKGSYAEIEDATAKPIRQLIVQVGDRANNIMTTATWLLDIAIGAAGSEVVLIPDLLLVASTGNDTILPGVLGPFPVWVPAGSRLAARAQCSINDATDRLIDVGIIGVY